MRLTSPHGFPSRLAGAFCLACTIAAMSLGCSRTSTAHVYGTVYAPSGKPLPGGTVVFYATEGRTLPGSAEINSDGSYDMPKAPTGKVKIAVTNVHLKEGTPPPVGMGGGVPSTVPPQAKGKAPMMGPPKTVDTSKAPGAKTSGGAAPDRYVPIPEKYAKPDTSELSVEVKPGTKQQHDIRLK